ncbi:Snakin-1, partial [Cucurbita argyrosperma subsp. sororia]
MKSGSLSLVLVSLVLSSFLLQHAIADSSATYAPRVKDRCLKYCGLCCQQCKCVPSGTYGNKSECPCYRDKLNSKGKSKCP